MGLTLITGSHPRHKYLADQLSKTGIDIKWIIEKSEDHIPEPDKDLDINLTKLFNLHFKKRFDSDLIFLDPIQGN